MEKIYQKFFLLLYFFIIFYFDLLVRYKPKNRTKIIALPRLMALAISAQVRLFIMYKSDWYFLTVSPLCVCLLVLGYWRDTTTIPTIIRMTVVMCNSRFNFPTCFFVHLLVNVIFDSVLSNMCEIVVYLICSVLGVSIKPVVVVSKGFSYNSHWYVVVGGERRSRTFELFKRKISEGKQKEKDNNYFIVEKQRKGRTGENLHWTDFIYIPFVRRGMVGMYVGQNIELSKAYIETFGYIEKNKYQVFFNDCQMFCHYFARRIGIAFHTIDTRKLILSLFTAVFSLFIRNTSLWMMYHKAIHK